MCYKLQKRALIYSTTILPFLQLGPYMKNHDQTGFFGYDLRDGTCHEKELILKIKLSCLF